MVGAEPGLPQGQRLFRELDGLGLPAKGEVAEGQVAHARDRVRVVGAELGLPQGQRLFAELEGLGRAGRGPSKRRRPVAMIQSVSGWSGPSSGCSSDRAASNCPIAISGLPRKWKDVPIVLRRRASVSGLFRESSLDRGQRGPDGIGQLHVIAQAACLTLGTGGGEDIVLDESEDRLDRLLRLLSSSAAARAFLRGKPLPLGRLQGLLLGETFSKFPFVRQPLLPLASKSPSVVPVTPASSASSTRLAAITPPRFLRTNFRSRYDRLGGAASTGSDAR